ncbi:MAG: radical SAM protein [Bacteroidales bacterium]|jgi:uncharacterized protein|nr:radical SAM protein [Bacteroidales bacterium]
MILYKTFKFNDNFYLYDTYTSKIIKLYKKAYDFINSYNLQDENITTDIYCKEKLFFEKLMKEDNILKNINWRYKFPYSEDEIQYLYKNSIQNIILELTTNCNLRCKYCTFNHFYTDSPNYSDEIMDISVIKKAIDFFFNNSSNIKNKLISFFGGEPLLCFGLIKNTLKYIKEYYNDSNIRYYMTTNLTKLNDEVLKYFVDNDIHIAVSIDGPEQIHDYNRVFLDGNGTFKIVYENLMKIKTDYPQYFANNISISTVLLSNKTFEKVAEFFYNLGLEVFYADLVPGSTYPVEDYDFFLESKENTFSEQEVKTMYFDNLSNNVEIKAFRSYFKYDEAFKMKNTTDTKYCFPSGPCMPGLVRTFVGCNGDIYICEKINKNIPYFNIGNVFNGIDLRKLNKLIKMHKKIGDKCISCWAVNKCPKCWTTINYDNCELQKAKVINSLLASINVYENYRDIINQL